jgi:hypothetical protein
VEVMRQVAIEKYPDYEEEVANIFSVSEADEAELQQYGMSGDTPLARVFTALHCKANGVLLPQLNIGIPEKDYACGHHLPAGIDLLPDTVVEDYQLDGSKRASKPFVQYVANAAFLAVTDRIQGFMHRSGVSAYEAQQATIVSILMNDIKQNFSGDFKKDYVEGIFSVVLGCVAVNKLAAYYAEP